MKNAWPFRGTTHFRKYHEQREWGVPAFFKRRVEVEQKTMWFAYKSAVPIGDSSLGFQQRSEASFAFHY